NQSVPGSSAPIIFDRAQPAAPTIAGDSLINAAEAGGTIVFTGSAEAGSTVQVTWGSTTRTFVAADGNWSASFLPTEVPADGSRPVTATAIDAAGNPSAPASFDVVVDRAGPT